MQGRVLAKELVQRPALLALLAFGIGIATRWLPALGLLLILPLAAVWVTLPSRNRVLSVTGLAVVAALGCWRSESPPTPLLDQRFFEGEATVASMPVGRQDGERAILRAGGVLAASILPLGSNVSMGDFLQVRGILKPLSEGTEQTYAARGVCARFTLLAPPRIVTRGALPWQVAAEIRRSFVAFAGRTLPQESASLVDALCFNQDAELSEELKEALRRTGTMHIISTSGLHVAIVAFALAFGFRLLPVPYAVQILLTGICATLYAAAAGLPPAAVRAVVMTLVVLAAPFFSKEADGLSALSVAGLLQLAWNPLELLGIGFQLSFVAVAALTMFLPLRLDTDRAPWAAFGARVRQVALGSLVATLATAPILAYHFGSVSLIAVAANLVIAPVVSAIVIVSLAAWAIGLVTPWLAAGLMVVLVLPMAQYLLIAVEAMGALPIAAISVPGFSPVWIVAIYLFPLAFWRPRVRAA